jgi:hypothetical protein
MEVGSARKEAEWKGCGPTPVVGPMHTVRD